MSTSSPDFVTVDMRGLKSALVARAKERRCSVSVIVREALARDLGESATGEGESGNASSSALSSPGWVKLSVRVTREEGLRIDKAARDAGLSRGAYLVGLSDRVPVLVHGGSRPDLAKSLVASCAEMATIGRKFRQFGDLLRIGDVPGAVAFKRSLDGWEHKLADHLRLATEVLAELRSPVAPGRRPATLASRRRR